MQTDDKNKPTKKPESSDAIEKAEIENALDNSWSVNDEDIKVKVVDDKVTLSGMVKSNEQKDIATEIAKKEPRVKAVYNELIVDPEF